jgi:hypothetical protein
MFCLTEIYASQLVPKHIFLAIIFSLETTTIAREYAFELEILFFLLCPRSECRFPVHSSPPTKQTPPATTPSTSQRTNTSCSLQRTPVTASVPVPVRIDDAILIIVVSHFVTSTYNFISWEGTRVYDVSSRSCTKSRAPSLIAHRQELDTSHPLADRDSPTRPGRSIKMGLHLYIILNLMGQIHCFCLGETGPRPDMIPKTVRRCLHCPLKDRCRRNQLLPVAWTPTTARTAAMVGWCRARRGLVASWMPGWGAKSGGATPNHLGVWVRSDVGPYIY